MAMLMPPRVHVLLRVTVLDTHVIFRIRSDSWRVLRFMDLYLMRLCSVQ